MLILAYHRVNPEIRDGLSISPSMLRQELAQLRARGWSNVVLEETLDERLPGDTSKRFAITFDDGYQDNFFHAAPILDELDMRATVYLVSSYIDSDTPFPWVRPVVNGTFDESDLHMTTAQLHEGLSAGVFTYGSHTRTHPLLSGLDHRRAYDEISGSRRELEDRLSIGIDTFCYPAGDFTSETVAVVQEAGYRAAVVTPNRYIQETDHTLHRVGIYSHITPGLFAIKTHPVFIRVQRLRAFWALRRKVGRFTRRSR